MKLILPAVALLMSAATAVAADSRTVTFFSDGALVEIETQATRGIARVSLSADAVDNTLRIKPMSGTTIQQVDVLPGQASGKVAKDLDLLQEQKFRLEDRLKALATREEVFKSAAKSQSGKAPRKSKANPDPMQSIRQSTEFAIAQLEAVYTAKRRTEHEIIRIDRQIAATRTVPSGPNTARITVSPNNGRIKVNYVLASQGWTPRYDIRTNNDGKAGITLYGQLPGQFSGFLLKASPGALSDKNSAPLPVTSGSLARLAVYNVPVSEEVFSGRLPTSFSYVLTNPGPVHLPAGEATFYRNGEYLGKAVFEGISSGRSKKVVFGK